jgi:hypothetical protein
MDFAAVSQFKLAAHLGSYPSGIEEAQDGRSPNTQLLKE